MSAKICENSGSVCGFSATQKLILSLEVFYLHQPVCCNSLEKQRTALSANPLQHRRPDLPNGEYETSRHIEISRLVLLDLG